MRQPLVSVIMPVRNEERFIARSLGAILAQDYPAEAMEVIVADGESDDATLAVIRALPGAERVQIVPNPRRTQATGLNEGIRRARGDIIVRVDGHAIIAPDYVRQSVAALAESGAQAAGGKIDPVAVTPTGRAIAAALKSRFAVPSAYHVSKRAGFVDQIYLGAWPREIFDQVGLFDERFVPNEDYEFHYRIRERGGRLFLTPAIRSVYYGRQTMGGLARQFYLYGRAKPRTLRRHPLSVRPRHLVAPAFAAYLLLGPVLLAGTALPQGRGLWPALVAWVGGLLLYILLNLTFSVAAAGRAGIAALPLLPGVFMVMHLVWGLGFWRGLFLGDPTLRGRGPAAWPPRLAPRSESGSRTESLVDALPSREAGAPAGER